MKKQGTRPMPTPDELIRIRTTACELALRNKPDPDYSTSLGGQRMSPPIYNLAAEAKKIEEYILTGK